jgi:dihydrofolate reductase
MIVALIAAVAKNNVIGKENDLPWYIPEDLKHFREITAGQTVVMGRKTYESIIARNGEPLPDRKNIVITRQKNYPVAKGVEVYPSLDEALAAHKNDDAIFVIGGAEIFTEALPKADRLYITHIDKEYEGDVYFPKVNYDLFSKVSEETQTGLTFVEYHKIRKVV